MSLGGMLLRGFGSGTGGSVLAPTLAVADDETGSGATAVVTAGTSDAAHAVDVQSVSNVGQAWVSGGSRTGNGSVSLTLARGYYWARCIATKGGASQISNLVYFSVTNGMDAIATKIIDALVAKIQGLTLDGVVSTNVVKAKLPWQRAADKLPCIIVSPAAENINAGAGTNERSDIDYRFNIVVMRASNEDLTGDMNWMARARERIRSSIHNQRLVVADVSAWRGIIEPAQVYIPPAFAEANLDVGSLIARITSRELPNL